MIYLDYASHTQPDLDIFNLMIEDAKNYPLNVNSLYPNTPSPFEKYLEYENGIKSIVGLNDYNFVLTSSATESNNLAIKGYSSIYGAFGKHIITTKYEHSSISGSLNTLLEKGYTVDYVNLTKDGFIDLNSLEALMKKDTILVSIGSVNSETGHIQNISKIAEIVHSKPFARLHVDATQSYGKIKLDYSLCDLISCSAHKIYGPTSGCGALFLKKDLAIKPLLDGGKSMSAYRSSTPDLMMVGALYNSTKKIFAKIDENFKHVTKLHSRLVEYFNSKNFLINSDINNPFILNVSVSINGQELQQLLAQKDVYISTKSSCSAKNSIPKSVATIYLDNNRAKRSIRISLSHKTTLEEVEQFITIIESILP